jgi:CheY-like chemotaxis protein
MLGNLSLITYKMVPDDPLMRSLKKIEESIRVAAKLTDQLLGYAQKGRYENINLQLNTLIRAAAGEFSASHESINMFMDLDQDLHLVEADQRQIEHVLWNLLSNAGDAMPNGGDLHIATRNIKRRDLRSKPYVLDKNEYIELLVRDTGIGMSSEIKNHIFDPFYTTKPMIVGKGAGLGMAATYGIIKSHEGFIEVSSEEGVGSEFVIYLPAIVHSGYENGDREETVDSGKTILLVDDERTSLEIGAQILEHLGYGVMAVSSGMEAVAKYRQDRERIALIILDMVMPEMSGIETFEQIKADFPEAKIFLASGFLLDAEARRILENGAEGFIKKPFAVDELRETIEKVLRSKPG